MFTNLAIVNGTSHCVFSLMEVINRVLGGELADKSNPAVDDIGVGDLSGLSTQRGLTCWETAKVGLNHHIATDQTVWKVNFVHLYAIFLLASGKRLQFATLKPWPSRKFVDLANKNGGSFQFVMQAFTRGQ